MRKMSFKIMHRPNEGQHVTENHDGPSLGIIREILEDNPGIWDCTAHVNSNVEPKKPFMGSWPIHSWDIEPTRRCPCKAPKGGLHGEVCSEHGLDPLLEPEESVNHPAHYGGAENPYEAIKVIEAWGLDFSLGNAVKYISRAGKKAKDKTVEDLKKAAWYLKRAIERLDGKPEAPKVVEVAWSSEIKSDLDKARREGALAAMDDAMGIVAAAQANIDADLSRASEQRPTTYIDAIEAKLIRRREELDKGLPRRG